jgi:hypothetical protein
LWGIVTVFTGLIPGFVKDTTTFFCACGSSDFCLVVPRQPHIRWARERFGTGHK